jgi:hypothetical protein
MPSSKAKGLPSKKELADVQQSVLKAVLLGEPLPGGGSAQLADLAFILGHRKINLLDENLAGPMSIKGLPKPLRVVSLEEIRREADTQDNVAYLRFLPPRAAEDGGIWVTLEGRLATSDKRQTPMGLSSIQVKLRKTGTGWEATGETRALAG